MQRERRRAWRIEATRAHSDIGAGFSNSAFSPEFAADLKALEQDLIGHGVPFFRIMLKAMQTRRTMCTAMLIKHCGELP
jgi:hypothetical protein